VPTRLVIDKVQILHKVKGRLRNTRVLRRGEKATFLVLYHFVTHLAPASPAATLLITQHGKVVKVISLVRHQSHGHPGFERTFALGKGYSGKLWTHFLLHAGSVYAERDRRLTVEIRR
jgi:hypothetical protein